MNAGQSVSDAALAQHFSAAFLAQVPPAQLVAALTQCGGGAAQVAGQLGRRRDRAGRAPRRRFRHVAQGVDRGRCDGAAPDRGTALSALQRDARADELAPGRQRGCGRGGHATMVAVEVARAHRCTLFSPTRRAPSAPPSSCTARRAGLGCDAGKRQLEREARHPRRLEESAVGRPAHAPSGRRFTLRYYRQQMIAVSDKHGRRHLIHRLGDRPSKPSLPRWHAGTATGHAVSDHARVVRPEAQRSAGTARRLRRGRCARRRGLLARIDAPRLAGRRDCLETPREVSTIEWFASPATSRGR